MENVASNTEQFKHSARASEILGAQAPIVPVVLETNLRRIRAFDACGQDTKDGSYNKLVRFLGSAWQDKQPINLLTILESNGFDDALWALRAVVQDQADTRDRVARLFAADCAEMVLHLFEQVLPDDSRPRNAIEVVRRFAVGETGREQLDAAWTAARAAAEAAAAEAAVWAAAAAAEAAARAAAAEAAAAEAAVWAAAAAAEAAARAAAAEAAAARTAARAAACQLFTARLAYRETVRS